MATIELGLYLRQSSQGYQTCPRACVECRVGCLDEDLVGEMARCIRLRQRVRGVGREDIPAGQHVIGSPQARRLADGDGRGDAAGQAERNEQTSHDDRAAVACECGNGEQRTKPRQGGDAVRRSADVSPFADRTGRAHRAATLTQAGALQ